jgi:hypothetical protein
MDHSPGRVPAKGFSLKAGLEDVHSPVGHDPEFEALRGAHAQSRCPFGFAVRMSELSDAADLRRSSDAG